jgi:hypothetical protein
MHSAIALQALGMFDQGRQLLDNRVQWRIEGEPQLI